MFIKKKICENFSFKFPIFDPRPIEKNRLFDRNFGNGGQLGYFFLTQSIAHFSDNIHTKFHSKISIQLRVIKENDNKNP